ncbi:MAG: hypothetical protein HFJ94_06250 [Muribaculaceae bacterium]|nr:hypothetical protein [Muribaculaceae bacterium]
MRHLILTLLALLINTAAFAAEPQRIYLDSIARLCDTTIVLPTVSRCDAVGFEARYGFPSAPPAAGPSAAYASIAWCGADSAARWQADFITGLSDTDDAVNSRFLRLSIHRTDAGGDTVVFSRDFDNIVPEKNGSLTICADINRSSATLAAGTDFLTPLTEYNGAFDPSGPIEFSVKGCAKTELLVLEPLTDPAAALESPHTAQSIAAATAAAAAPEGIWTFLDRDTDSRRALAGGRYTLGIIKQSDGPGYDIIYLGGAEVNSSRWKEGMKKGTLTPTIFSNHYDLTWFDSQMEPIERDANASVEQSSILTLSFPLMKSTLRFYRRTPDK